MRSNRWIFIDIAPSFGALSVRQIVFCCNAVKREPKLGPPGDALFWIKQKSTGGKSCYNLILTGPVAQLVEQRIENPRVTGSIPVPGTILL